MAGQMLLWSMGRREGGNAAHLLIASAARYRLSHADASALHAALPVHPQHIRCNNEKLQATSMGMA